MIIDWREVSAEALQGLAEQYVNSESGEQIDDSMSLEQKAQQVLQAIHRGELVITYSELHQSVYLQPKEKFTAPGADEYSEQEQYIEYDHYDQSESYDTYQ